MPSKGKAVPTNREFLHADFVRKPSGEAAPTNREFLHTDFVRKPPEEAAVAGLDYPSTLVGTVGNITVYYATSLGASGQTLATAMLGRVIGPYSDMEAWFGVSGAPVAVGNSILVIAWHLLSNPDAHFTDLGPDWHDKIAPIRRKRQLIAELERLSGKKVLLQEETAA